MVFVACILLATAVLIWLGHHAPWVLLTFAGLLAFVWLPIFVGSTWLRGKR
jgi:hypothetical protein